MHCLEGCPVFIFRVTEFSQADAQVIGRRMQHNIILIPVPTYMQFITLHLTHIMIHSPFMDLKKGHLSDFKLTIISGSILRPIPFCSSDW
jgi:hypothetical protein